MDATQEHSAPARPDPHDGDPLNARDILSELSARFCNFDDEATYESLLDQALSAQTENFAVRFGLEKAEIAINLRERELKTLLQVQADKKDDNVTWINIWSPDKNSKIVEAIAAKYKFSTRLKETIAGWDGARRLVARSLATRGQARKQTYASLRGTDMGMPRPRLRSTFHKHVDPEKGPDRDEENERRGADQRQKRALHEEDLDMYRLLQTQYNYTTIDHGSSFICIGANWLHHRPMPDSDADESGDIYKNPESFVPPKHWAWYILTNEGTVISIHEDPNYGNGNEVDAQEQRDKELANMRKNMRDLLHQLSRPGMSVYKSRVSARKGVRSDLVYTNQPRGGPLPSARTTHLESPLTVDASANLFYYLFEDYTAATSILSESSRVLAKVTHDVLHITDRKNKDKDSSDIIKLLYARSKDLRQLRHLFISYENLIKGIMALGTDTASDEKEYAALVSSSTSLSAGGGPARGVKLSQKAFDRFDRLSIRMRLLMLDTIDEYLAEKASLSDTYFNLMSQKDSQATSKLNRSASLLAKLSVFFLPISFMTSYFSVQIPDLTNNYTGATYWICFAVIAAMSFLSLFFFSRLLMFVSDVLDEKVAATQEWAGRGMLRVGRKLRGKSSATLQGESQGGGGGGERGEKRGSVKNSQES